MVVGLVDLVEGQAILLEALTGIVEALVGITQEDEAENGRGEFGGLEPGACPKLVGSGPEARFEFGKVGGQQLSCTLFGSKGLPRALLWPRLCNKRRARVSPYQSLNTDAISS